MIAVLGAGAWGKSLAAIASANGYDVNIWSRKGTLSLADAVTGAEIVVSAISMQGVREVIKQLQGLTLSPHTIIISATKGLDSQTPALLVKFGRMLFPIIP